MSSAHYVLFATIFFIIAAAVTVGVHWAFTRDSFRQTPWLIHGIILTSVWVCLVPFPLLVLDVDAAGAAKEQQGAYVDGMVSPIYSWCAPWWYTIFFSTQILAWAALPVAQEYDTAGEFTAKERFKQALKQNVKLYIALGVVAAFLMGYLLFLKGVNSFSGAVTMCLAAANAFGLLLLVIFLATGVIGIPKRLWRMADARDYLEDEYCRARIISEDLSSAKTDVILLRGEVARRDPHVTDEEREKLAFMLEEFCELEKSVNLAHTQIHLDRGADEDRKHETLVELNCDVKRTIRLCRRLNAQWHATVRTVVELDRVVNSPKAEIYWSLLRKPLLRVLAVCCGILTIVVLWSELVVPFQTIDNGIQLSLVELVMKDERTRFVGGTIILSYMATCAYWAIFQFHIFDVLVVVLRVSDAASLCFAATFLTRLIIPLCYNFLWIGDLAQKHNLVVYSHIFGRMDVVDFLGQWFNQFIPILIPALAILIELKMVHRFLTWVGIEGWETGKESIETRRAHLLEGHGLVSREAGIELGPIRYCADQSMDDKNSGDATPAAASGGASASKASSAADDRPGRRYEEWKAKRAKQGTADSSPA